MLFRNMFSEFEKSYKLSEKMYIYAIKLHDSVVCASYMTDFLVKAVFHKPWLSKTCKFYRNIFFLNHSHHYSHLSMN